jgi:signal transduction histidine kinase
MSGVKQELLSLRDTLSQIPLFAGVTADDVARLCKSSRRISAQPGDTVIVEGSAGDALYVILTGELEITKRDGESEVVLASRKAGEVLGEMSLLEGTPRSASARAVAPSELLEIGADAFRSLLESNPATAANVLRTVTGRLRSTESTLMQREKLASLGTLAAGLAHELNNPAAAIQRSSEYLSEAFTAWRRTSADVHGAGFSDAERQRLTELERSIASCGPPATEGSIPADVESRFIEWLESVGVGSPWEIAPQLLAYGWTRDRVEPLATLFTGAHFNLVMQWLGAGLAAQQLMEEIRRSARAISDIVRAVKSYTHLDQAPVQDVDVRESVENTLVILRHKLKHGVKVERDFAVGLPRIEAYAGELNQVWTNLIDNAIQAMNGEGVLEVGARQVGDVVEVRVVDNGPGIPAEIRGRVFDPFFTTKEAGVGSGLGLHIVHNIVVNRHRGRIHFDSRPGRTEFRVTLPLRLGGAHNPQQAQGRGS